MHTSILILVQYTHPSGLCIWRIKILVCVHYFVAIYSRKYTKLLISYKQ